MASLPREPGVVGLHRGQGRPSGTPGSYDAGEESGSTAVVPLHLSGLARGRRRWYGGAEQAGGQSGKGQGPALRPVRLGAGCAGVPLALRGTWGKPCCLRRCCIPQGLRRLTEALCRRMRSRSQLCPLGWASGSGCRESVLDGPHPIGSPRSGAIRKEAKRGVLLCQAPDSSCHSS